MPEKELKPNMPFCQKSSTFFVNFVTYMPNNLQAAIMYCQMVSAKYETKIEFKDQKQFVVILFSI